MRNRNWHAAMTGITGWLLFFVICPSIGLLTYSGTGGHILLLGVYFILAVPFLFVGTVLLKPQTLGQALRIAATESGLLFLLAPFSLVYQQSRALSSPISEYAGDFPTLVVVFALFAAASTLLLAIASPPLVRLTRTLSASSGPSLNRKNADGAPPSRRAVRR